MKLNLSTAATGVALAFAGMLALAGPVQAQSGNPVTIKVWMLAGPENNVWQVIKTEYAKTHPNVSIDISVQEQSAMTDLLAPTIASGKEDVDLLFSWTGLNNNEWGREGLIADLTPYYTSRGWFDNMSESVVTYTDTDGKLYTYLTDSTSPGYIYYNEDVFSEIGVDVPKTLDNLIAISQKARDAGYEPIATGLLQNNRGAMFTSQVLSRFLPAEDYDKFVKWEMNPTVQSAAILNDPRIVDAVAYMQKLIDNGVFVRGTEAMDAGSAKALFENGKAAMYFDGSWASGYWATEVPDMHIGYFPIPAASAGGEVKLPLSLANSLIVPAKVTQDKAKLDAVLDLLDFINQSKDVAIAYYQQGLLSTNKNITPDELAAAGVNPMLTEIVAGLSKSPTTDYIAYWSTTGRYKAFNDSLAQIFTKAMSPEQGMQYFHDQSVEIAGAK